MRPSISGFVFLEEKMLVEIPNEAIWTTMTGGPTIFVTSRSVEGVDDVMALRLVHDLQYGARSLLRVADAPAPNDRKSH